MGEEVNKYRLTSPAAAHMSRTWTGHPLRSTLQYTCRAPPIPYTHNYDLIRTILMNAQFVIHSISMAAISLVPRLFSGEGPGYEARQPLGTRLGNHWHTTIPPYMYVYA